MTASSYPVCLRSLLAHEGGYTNHPSDPGGPTNFGITLADYRRYAKPGATAADVKAMRVDEAKAIYKSKYWDALNCDELPAGVDDSVFDYGVNSGVGRAGKVLRRVLGLPDSDWRVTVEVLNAVAKRDPKALITAINAERLRFLQGLKTWPVFGAGWARRVGEVREFSMALATAKPEPVVPKPSEGKGQVPPNPKGQAGAAGGAVVAGGGAASNATDPTVIAIIVIATIVIAVAGVVALRRWQKRQQEQAMPGIPVVPETRTA